MTAIMHVFVLAYLLQATGASENEDLSLLQTHAEVATFVKDASLKCVWFGDSSGNDEWCNSNCNHNPPHCPSDSCLCDKEESEIYGEKPPTDPFKICTNLDVVYGPDGEDGRYKMLADFYFPCEEAPAEGRTAIIGLHGKNGARTSQKYLAEGFVNMDFMFVPIDWRQSKRYADVQHAANFIYGKRLELKVSKIYLYGYSSGGLLGATVILGENVQYIDGAVIAAGVIKKHAKMGHDKVNPVLFIGCDDDTVVAPKYSQQLTSNLLDMGVMAAHTSYKSSCGHYPMASMFFYHDIIRFFKDPISYYESDPVKVMPAGHWETISEGAGCTKNDEGVTVKKTVTMYTLAACMGLCLSTTDTITCVAIDYNGGKKTCNLYEKACLTPLAENEKVTSMRWVSEEGTMTTTPAPPSCNKKLCIKKTKPWFKKCKLQYCKACEECSEDSEEGGAPSCSEKCAKNEKKPWSKKCNYPHCKACTECTASFNEIESPTSVGAKFWKAYDGDAEDGAEDDAEGGLEDDDDDDDDEGIEDDTDMDDDDLP